MAYTNPKRPKVKNIAIPTPGSGAGIEEATEAEQAPNRGTSRFRGTPKKAARSRSFSARGRANVSQGGEKTALTGASRTGRGRQRL